MTAVIASARSDQAAPWRYKKRGVARKKGRLNKQAAQV
jgi:hypothetical protein